MKPSNRIYKLLLDLRWFNFSFLLNIGISFAHFDPRNPDYSYSKFEGTIQRWGCKTNSSPPNVRGCKTINQEQRKFGLALDQERWPTNATCRMIQSPIFTSKPSIIHILLNLHSIGFVLLLPNQKTIDTKASSLHNSPQLSL